MYAETKISGKQVATSLLPAKKTLKMSSKLDLCDLVTMKKVKMLKFWLHIEAWYFESEKNATTPKNDVKTPENEATTSENYAYQQKTMPQQ